MRQQARREKCFESDRGQGEDAWTEIRVWKILKLVKTLTFSTLIDVIGDIILITATKLMHGIADGMFETAVGVFGTMITIFLVATF